MVWLNVNNRCLGVFGHIRSGTDKLEEVAFDSIERIVPSGPGMAKASYKALEIAAKSCHGLQDNQQSDVDIYIDAAWMRPVRLCKLIWRGSELWAIC